MIRMQRVKDIFIGTVLNTKPIGPSKEFVRVVLESGAVGEGWTVSEALVNAYRATDSDQSNSGPSTGSAS